MKHKLQVLFLFIALLLISGCDVKYNLKINNDGKVYEVTQIVENNHENWDSKNLIDNTISSREFLEMQLKTKTYALYNTMGNPYNLDENDDNYYTQENISNDTQLGIKYDFAFTKDNYSRSSMINACYKKVSFSKNNGVSLLSTDSKFNCFDMYGALDKVEISIDIDKKIDVLDNNADSVNNNVYTWIITKDNASNKPILLKYKEKKFFNTTLSVLIGVIAVLAISALVVTIVKISSKKNNKL